MSAALDLQAQAKGRRISAGGADALTVPARAHRRAAKNWRSNAAASPLPHAAHHFRPPEAARCGEQAWPVLHPAALRIVGAETSRRIRNREIAAAHSGHGSSVTTSSQSGNRGSPAPRRRLATPASRHARSDRQFLAAVARPGQHRAIAADHHRAHRHLAPRGGLPGLLECDLHRAHPQLLARIGPAGLARTHGHRPGRHHPRRGAARRIFEISLVRARTNYADAIAGAGGLPLALPHLPALAAATAGRIDALVVTGGAFDVDPALYGDARRHDTVTLKETAPRPNLRCCRARSPATCRCSASAAASSFWRSCSAAR